MAEKYGTSLKWVQPHMSKRAFELKDSEKTIATLEWEKMFGTLARGRIDGQEWTFKRTGFWSPKVTARKPGSDKDVMTFVPKWAGDGTLTMEDGKRYAWKSSGLLNPKWTFIEEDVRNVMELKPTGAFLKFECEVDISPDSAGTKDMLLLALIGWYLIILWYDDAAGAAATTAAM